MNKGLVSLAALFVLVVFLLPIVVVAGSQIIIRENEQYILETPGKVASALDDTPRTAIVFGSGLEPDDGTPRPVLTARLDATFELYRADAIGGIIVSGAVEPNYNEPRAMRDYLTAHGVPADIIRQDPEGNRTFDTCTRAQEVFGVDEAVLVTQASHLDRAIYLCRSQDIMAYGYAAEPAGSWAARQFQELREAASNIRAVYDTLTAHIPAIEQ